MRARAAPHRKTPTLTTDQLKLQVLSALQRVHTREEAEHVLAEEMTRLYREGYANDTAQLWASEYTRRLIERDGANGPTALPQEDISSLVEAMYGAKHGAGQGAAQGATPATGAPEKEKKEKKQTDLLYDIARRDLLLYKDSAGMCWAGLPQKDGGYLHVDLGSGKVSQSLHSRFYHEHDTTIGPDAVRTVLATIQGDLAEESETRENFVRLAWHPENGKLYVDLHGNKATEIDAEGWRIIEGPPVYFRRPVGVLPQVEPQRGGSLETLREILGLEDGRNWRLLVGFLLSAFHPTGPYPVLVLSGEQGTGKSTAALLLGRLIDPNTAQLEKAPTREDDIPVQAAARHLLAWDNLSAVPSWFSDALCGLATQLTQSRRKLYSDADIHVFNATKPTLINGIEDLATRPDLLNRALLVQFEKMPEAKRKEREVVLEAFEEARPALLGAIFDAVSCAMRNKDRVRIENAPRMADMAYWVTQAEPALGWPWGAYLQAFQRSAEEASSIALESSPLAQGLLQWLDYYPQVSTGYEGYAADLLSELNASLRIGNDIRFRKGWPKLANYLTNNLRRIAPELRKQGWEIAIDRKAQGAYVTIHRAAHDDTSTGSDATPKVIVLDEAQTASGVPPSHDGRDGHDDKMHGSSVYEGKEEETTSERRAPGEAPNDRQERHHRQGRERSVDEAGFDVMAWLITDISDENEDGTPIAVCPTCGKAAGSNPLNCLECEVRVLLDTENARCRHQGAYVSGTGDGAEVYSLSGEWRTVTTTQTCDECGTTFYCEKPEEHQEAAWLPFGCPYCDNAVLLELGRADRRLEDLRKQAHMQRARQLVARTVCEICGAPAWPNELCPMHLRFEDWREHHPDAMVGGNPECGHEDIREEGDSVIICATCGGRWQCDHPDLYEKAEGGFGCPDCFFVWTKQNTSAERLAEMLAELEAKYARRKGHTAS